MNMNDLPHEHEFEPVRGLPEELPSGERMLWQGSPDPWAVARRLYRVPLAAAYFGAMLALPVVVAIADGRGMMEGLANSVLLAPLAAIALGMLGLLAWLTARTTVYTITDRRVVMRIGIVLTLTYNLPYRAIASAERCVCPDGSGDIALKLGGKNHIGYLNLWPHTRPWHVKHPQPALRCIPDVVRVAGLLRDAVAASGAAAVARSATPSSPEGARQEPSLRPSAHAA
jgi:hypothetical protein